MYFWEIQFSLANLAHYEVTIQTKEENPMIILTDAKKAFDKI